MLNAFDLTLTLPGIAGIILSIGMAVDANVIIYARIREEIAAGKSVRSAIKIGFEKAMSAIVDGNITTLIAAAVLGAMGSGSVKGFAMTLALGIVLSMFTALVISRWLVKALYGLGFQDKKFYGEKKERKSINFLGKRGLFFGISLAVIVAGFVGMGAHKAGNGQPLNFSMEFKGGTATTVAFDKDYTIEEIDEQIVPYIEEVTGDANVQTQKVADSNSIIIKTRTLNLDEREKLATAMEDNFGVQENDITSTNISSTISSEMRSDAIVAVIIATICMLIYIWFRFKDIRFASSAVIALVHDVLVVLAFYALSQTSVGSTFIACMLTLVGYSINATIVIFDRIRENLALESGRRDTDLKEVVNKSITQTLSRSINTSLTTFIMVFVLFILGVSSIREFAGPLMVGVICGGYSSVCITGALWYVMKTRLGEEAKAARAASGTKTVSVKAADKKEGTTSTESNAADTSADDSSKKKKGKKIYGKFSKSLTYTEKSNLYYTKNNKLIKKGCYASGVNGYHKYCDQQAFMLQNDYRKKASVVKLEWSDVLYEICKVRAKDIVDEFSHTKLDSTAKNVLKNKYGYEEWMLWGNVGTKGYGVCIISGENIFSGSSSPKHAMKSWKNSQGHYHNMVHIVMVQ